MSQSLLLNIVRESITEVFEAHSTINKSKLLEEHPVLNEPLAACVSIYIDNKLRSEGGSIKASSLLENIIHHAKLAAFQDTQNPPLKVSEYLQASIELSALLITIFIIFLSILFALPFAIFSKFNYIKFESIDDLRPSHNAVFTFFLVFPSLWVLGEWFRGWVFSGFPWLYLGYAHTDTWLSGWAPVTGVLGISWIVAFCSVLLGFLFQLTTKAKSSQNQFIFMPMVCALSLVIFFWVGGLYLKKIE